MALLGNVVLPKGKGDHYGVMAKDEESGKSVLAWVWCDRDRRYFVSSCSSLTPGTMIRRKRWRQVDKTPNADPELTDIEIPQPEATEIYYKGCQRIDQHNRIRQASLCLERKVGTNDWDKRANMTLFGMMCTDAYYLASGCQPNRYPDGSRQFWEDLATDLIDNDWDRRSLRKRKSKTPSPKTKPPTVGLDSSLHLVSPTPTKKRKAANAAHRVQGRCMWCNMSTTKVCRECQTHHQGLNDKQFWICDKPGKICMGYHILDKHPSMVPGCKDEEPNVI